MLALRPEKLDGEAAKPQIRVGVAGALCKMITPSWIVSGIRDTNPKAAYSLMDLVSKDSSGQGEGSNLTLWR